MLLRVDSGSIEKAYAIDNLSQSLILRRRLEKPSDN